MNIRVAFTASAGLGDIIMAATGGDCNHSCFLYFDEMFQTEMVLGANANGLTSQALFNFGDKIVHTFSPLQAGFEVGLRKNTKWLDSPYDYAGLLGMAVVEAERLIGDHKAANPFLSRQALFCSEIAAMVIRDSGYPILPDITAGSIDPNQLKLAMLAQPIWFEHKLGI